VGKFEQFYEFAHYLHIFILGNTAQYACGIFRKNRALISSLFLAIHKVFLRKSAIIRTRFFSESALAALCGIAFTFRRALREAPLRISVVSTREIYLL